MTSDEELDERARRGLEALAAEARPFDRRRLELTMAPRRQRGRWVAPLGAAVAAAAVILGAALLLDSRDPDQDRVAEPPRTTATATVAPDPSLVAKDQVRDAAAMFVEMEDVPGYAQVRLDFARREVKVYWKGTPPRRVREAAGINPDGVLITLVPSRYSHVELTQASRKVFERARELGIVVHGVGRSEDFSSLEVFVDASELSKRTAAELEALLGNAAGVEVSVAPGEEPVLESG